jgi:hypothetical protein
LYGGENMLFNSSETPLSPVAEMHLHRAPIPEEEPLEPLPGEEPTPDEEEPPPHPDPSMESRRKTVEAADSALARRFTQSGYFYWREWHGKSSRFF